MKNENKRPSELEIAESNSKLFKELQALEKASGIFEVAEKIRENSYYEVPSPLKDALPLWDKDYEARVDQTVGSEYRQIRRLYFSVSDVEQRKLIFSKFNELASGKLSYYDAWRIESLAAIKRARLAHSDWLIWAACSTIILIFVGNILLQLPGAISGAAVGYFLSKRLELETNIEREDSIREARDTAETAQRTYNEYSRDIQEFSDSEVRTGEPD